MATQPDDEVVGRRVRVKRPTAADVAREAGLSRATVSYVLNNTPHQAIPETTRQRVLRAAADLGYTPSAAARALSSGRSDVVLLLLPDWPIGSSVGRLLEHLSAALADRGLTFVAHPHSASRAVSEVWKAVTPAAVITFEELDEREAARIRAAGIDLTVALFGGERAGRALDIPEQRLGRLQAEHLAVAGHRQLGYAWPDDPRVATFSFSRLEGVRQTCADLGLDPPEVVAVPLTGSGAAAAVRRWRDAESRVTGICAYNDEVALAVLAGARREGLRVPADVAVIGADDIPAAALADPALTTIHADSPVIARYLSDTITANLLGQAPPRRPGSDVHMIIERDSV